MKKFLCALFVLFCSAAYAQNAGTVTNHAFPIGKGPGVSGYTSLLCASGQLAIGSATDPTCRTMSGDATLSAVGALTLATVNANVGTFGSATQASQVTLDGKGRATAAANVTVTPAIGSITGLGTSVATALGVNVGTAGAVLVNGGALGTPSSGTATNLTGLPIAGVTGLGTGVATALGVNVGSAGAFVTFNGALGTPSSGSGANLTALNATQLTSGTIPAARTNGHQNGTATNDNAAAGEIGELIFSNIASGSAVSLTSTLPANMTSIPLTAGDWDVDVNCVFNIAATTNITNLITSISTTTGTLDLTTGGAYFIYRVAPSVPGGGMNVVAGPLHISLASPTTIFAVAQSAFTVSTNAAYGILRARRMR